MTESSTHCALDGAENCVWVLQFDGGNSQTKSDISVSCLKAAELILEPGVCPGHRLHDGGVEVADVGLGGGAHVLAPLQS